MICIIYHNSKKKNCYCNKISVKFFSKFIKAQFFCQPAFFFVLKKKKKKKNFYCNKISVRSFSKVIKAQLFFQADFSFDFKK